MARIWVTPQIRDLTSILEAAAGTPLSLRPGRFTFSSMVAFDGKLIATPPPQIDQERERGKRNEKRNISLMLVKCDIIWSA